MLRYNGLDSSTRKSLQMGYADMCINGKLLYMPVENLSNCYNNFTPTSVLGSGFQLVRALYKEDFSVVVGKFRWLTL